MAKYGLSFHTNTHTRTRTRTLTKPNIQSNFSLILCFLIAMAAIVTPSSMWLSPFWIRCSFMSQHKIAYIVHIRFILAFYIHNTHKECDETCFPAALCRLSLTFSLFCRFSKFCVCICFLLFQTVGIEHVAIHFTQRLSGAHKK